MFSFFWPTQVDADQEKREDENMPDSVGQELPATNLKKTDSWVVVELPENDDAETVTTDISVSPHERETTAIVRAAQAAAIIALSQDEYAIQRNAARDEEQRLSHISHQKAFKKELRSNEKQWRRHNRNGRNGRTKHHIFQPVTHKS